MLILGANILVTVMATLFVLTCLFMMLVILIQKPKGGGLSGAFGGAGGSSQAAFGAKTGDLLTTITIGCFVAFLGLAIGLTYAIRADVAPRTACRPTLPTRRQTRRPGRPRWTKPRTNQVPRTPRNRLGRRSRPGTQGTPQRGPSRLTPRTRPFRPSPTRSLRPTRPCASGVMRDPAPSE
jgi:protein translocase SecG subunit